MTETDTPLHPSGFLMNLIIALLAPMFLGVTGGDVGLAQMAAIETVNDYRARNNAGLVAVAQIIAFGLAALGSLSLSMADDISLSMTLRLRGNANACNRSAEQSRRALTGNQAEDHSPTPAEAEPEAEPEPGAFLSSAAAQELAAESDRRLQPPSTVKTAPAQASAPQTNAEKRNQAMWAIAMVKESGDIAANIRHLPLAEREAAAVQAAMLSGTAYELLNGAFMPSHAPTPRP
jgi:hypothetical protein